MKESGKLMNIWQVNFQENEFQRQNWNFSFRSWNHFWIISFGVMIFIYFFAFHKSLNSDNAKKFKNDFNWKCEMKYWKLCYKKFY